MKGILVYIETHAYTLCIRMCFRKSIRDYTSFYNTSDTSFQSQQNSVENLTNQATIGIWDRSFSCIAKFEYPWIPTTFLQNAFRPFVTDHVPRGMSRVSDVRGMAPKITPRLGNTPSCQMIQISTEFKQVVNDVTIQSCTQHINICHNWKLKKKYLDI